MNLLNKKVMVVVAHPDDEVLGIGGTIYKLVKKYKCEIKVVILGEGITSRDRTRNVKKQKQKLLQHNKDILLAKKFLKYQILSTYDFPDNRFDTIPLLDLIKIVEIEKESFNPEIIFTHHNGDLNIDHRLTFEAVYTACRPMANENVKTLITFETMSGTEWISSNEPKKFNPNFFVELNKNELSIKINAMESYSFEKRGYPHPRSPKAIENRTEMWGISIGKNYAEAFQIVRHLI